MAEARRTGGLVSREAVLERIAARAAPLPAPRRDVPAPAGPVTTTTAAGLMLEEVDFSAVDMARQSSELSRLTFVTRAVVDALREHPRLRSVLGADERLGDLRLRALDERLSSGGSPVVHATTMAASHALPRGQDAALVVGEIRMRPVAVPAGDQWGMALRPIAHLSLAYATGTIEATDAAAFLQRVRHIVETRDWRVEL